MPYFSDPENVERLFAAFKAWNPTRFYESASMGRTSRGASADCVGWGAGVLQDAGAIGRFPWPEYETHGSGPEMFHVMEAAIDGIPQLAKIWRRVETRKGLEPRPETKTGVVPPESDPTRIVMVGDVVIGSKATHFHHFAIYQGENNVRHLKEGGGVVVSNINVPDIRHSIIAIYRSYAEKRT